MYNVRYESDLGESFDFGYDYGVIFDLDPLGGLDVNVSTSQGYAQIGNTVESQSVAGVVRQLKGRIIRNVSTLRARMAEIFAPMTSGTLIFNSKYSSWCVVKMTPTFQAGSKWPRFELQVYSPSPYWYSIDALAQANSQISKEFQFPVNYGTPHRFGTTVISPDFVVVNRGVDTYEFSITIRTTGETVNPSILNKVTGEFIGLNTTINSDETYKIYRKNGRLYVEKTIQGRTTDAFDVFDDDSTLFTMRHGDNDLRVQADSGATELYVSIDLHEAIPGVYDGL